MKPQILSETPLSMSELKEELDKTIKKGEPNMRVTKTHEYLEQFSLLSKKDADELKSKIDDLKIPRLKEEQIIKIIDILPETIDELKVVLQSYTLTVTQENMKKIIEKIKEYKK